MSHDVTDFQSEVIEKSRHVPVLVDFWAPWCGPCRVLGPVLERLAAEARGEWVLAKVNTEQHPELAAEYGIQSIPNVKLFADGEVVDEFLGALPESQIRGWLEQAIPSPYSDAVARARGMLSIGQFAEAAAALRAIVAEEPGLRDARLALAETLPPHRPGGGAGGARGPRGRGRPGRSRRGPAPAGRARRAARPAGGAARITRQGALPGRALGRARGDWDQALGSFIEVMRGRRDYAGGAAQEAGRGVFVLLGWQHPVCEKHHRAFASARNV